VEFHFTQIDREDPEKMFGLAVKIRPDKSISGQSHSTATGWWNGMV